jgi:hypothetical protein
MIARRIGIEKMALRMSGKFLSKPNVPVAACIAFVNGVVKCGASMALTDLAKQKLVILSMVRQRNAEKKSADVLLSALFFASTDTRWST